MKNELIQKNIRRFVEDRVLGALCSDKKLALKWILDRFEEYDKKQSIDGLIELSSQYSVFLAPTPCNVDTERMYKVLGLKGTMTYRQFIFELPKIWYTTLFRLIQEWKADGSEGELAY